MLRLLLRTALLLAVAPAATHAACADAAGWSDVDGDGCSTYDSELCGAAAKSSANAAGVSANEACCVCGGGSGGSEKPAAAAAEADPLDDDDDPEDAEPAAAADGELMLLVVHEGRTHQRYSQSMALGDTTSAQTACAETKLGQDCEAAIGRFFAAPKPRSASEERMRRLSKEASTFVGQLFKVSDRSRIAAEAKRAVLEAKVLHKRTHKRERQGRKQCEQQFAGDTGSVVRCLLDAGWLLMAEKMVDELLSKYPPHTALSSLPEHIGQTVILCSFVKALLHEWLRLDMEAKRLPVLWDNFKGYAAAMHTMNSQLELLYVYAFMSQTRLDRQYPDHWVVRSATEPAFFMSTLDPAKDSHFAVDLGNRGMWEPDFTHLFNHAVTSVDIGDFDPSELAVMDVGGNLGWFSMVSASLGFRVVAFEPVPDHCQRFRQSIALNNFATQPTPTSGYVELNENIVSTRLSDTLKIRRFMFGPSPTAYVVDGNEKGDESNADGKSDDVVVKAVRADGAGIGGAKAVAAVKIDVEGCEIDALNSASGLLTPRGGATRPPEVFLELCPYLWQRCKTKNADELQAWKLLKKHGYTLYLHHHDNGYEKCPTLPKSFERTRSVLKDGHKMTMFHVPLTQDGGKALVDWSEKHKRQGGSSACFQIWATQQKPWDPVDPLD